MAQIANGESTTFCTLRQIANWQLDQKNSSVSLPALQRGYVWKPKQVETLWDSLLRGFPVGSFLVSENGTETKDLLDGQQRATAIAMGFYNPWEESGDAKFFSGNFKNVEQTAPVLWLDLGVIDEGSMGEKGDFLFMPRLVTQSHPWGFNRNGDILGIAHRRKAVEKFNMSENSYPHYNLKDVLPWMAELPVPLSFLLDAFEDGINNWKEVLITKCKSRLENIKTKNFQDSSLYFDALEKILGNESVASVLISAIQSIHETLIPIVSLKKKHFVEESKTANGDDSTLFIRINTSGTRLEGEELIYSMYKAVFPKAKDIVEEAGSGFISPSRIINLISRIVLTDIELDKNNFGNLKFARPLNLKKFKEKLNETDGGFFENLRIFSDAEKPYVKILFNKAKAILVGKKSYQLPFPLAADIAKGNSDILFILLYWIHNCRVEVDELLQDDLQHKKVLAAVTALYWFSLDTTRYLNQLEKLDEVKSGTFEFWSPALFSEAHNATIVDYRWITYIPSPLELEKILLNKFLKTWEQVVSEKMLLLFNNFRWKFLAQKGMLLFVQRAYIKEKFEELQWETLLEDTNRPWDWDHIYPSVYNQKGTYDEVRGLNYTIGNLRAWALVDNRSDQANLPLSKLDDKRLRDKSFILENDWEYWYKIDSGRITDNDEQKAKLVCTAIYTRLTNIFREWYDTLSVGSLIEIQFTQNYP